MAILVPPVWLKFPVPPTPMISQAARERATARATGQEPAVEVVRSHPVAGIALAACDGCWLPLYQPSKRAPHGGCYRGRRWRLSPTTAPSADDGVGSAILGESAGAANAHASQPPTKSGYWLFGPSPPRCRGCRSRGWTSVVAVAVRYWRSNRRPPPDPRHRSVLIRWCRASRRIRPFG